MRFLKPPALLGLVTALAASALAQTPAPAPGDAGVRDHRDLNAGKGYPASPRLRDYIQILESPKRVEAMKVDAVVASLQLKKDSVVADLGCGPGVFTLALSRAVPDGVVYAVDIEPALLDAVRDKVKSSGLHNVVPVLASYDDSHLPPHRVDLILIADTYHHLDDRVAYLKNLARVLRPGGRVVILDYKPGELATGPAAAHKLDAGVREAEFAEAGYVLGKKLELLPDQDFEFWKPKAAGR